VNLLDGKTREIDYYMNIIVKKQFDNIVLYNLNKIYVEYLEEE